MNTVVSLDKAFAMIERSIQHDDGWASANQELAPLMLREKDVQWTVWLEE